MYITEKPDRSRALIIVFFLLLCCLSAGAGFIFLQDAAHPLARQVSHFGHSVLRHPGRVIFPMLLFVLAIFSLFIFARLFMRLGNNGVVLFALAIMGMSIVSPRSNSVFLQGGPRCLVIGGGGGGKSYSATPAPVAPTAAPMGMAGGNS